MNDPSRCSNFSYVEDIAVSLRQHTMNLHDDKDAGFCCRDTHHRFFELTARTAASATKNETSRRIGLGMASADLRVEEKGIKYLYSCVARSDESQERYIAGGKV